jgi:hypothetical protein
VLGILQAFPGYTFSTLMEEDAEFVRLIAIRAMGTKQEKEVEDDG